LITRQANQPKQKPIVDTWDADPNADVENRRTGSKIFFYPDYDMDTEMDIEINNASAVHLAHELLGHSYDLDTGTQRKGESKRGIKLFEVDAVNIENEARKTFRFDKRTEYGKKKIMPEELWDTHSE